MAHPSNVFSEQGRQRVNQAVQDAESKTSAEIVPVVATSSGRYDRPEDVVGVWFAALAVSIAWLAHPLPNVDIGSWDAAAPAWQLATMLFALVIGFVAGAAIATRVGWLRRLFTPGAQMRAEVSKQARQVFFDHRVHHAAGRSGVLLYVSLFERTAAVIADQKVLDTFGDRGIDEICRELTARLHKAPLVDALCETVRMLGERLSPVLPRAAADVNELPDALVVVE